MASDSLVPSRGNDEAINSCELDEAKLVLSEDEPLNDPTLGGAKSMFENGFEVLGNDEEACA